MKFALPFLSLVIILSSCRSYRYFSLEGENIRIDSSFRFAMENDCLRLEYDFSGDNGPVSVTVFNKLTVPLYVNWRRSALVTGVEAQSYYAPDIQWSGSTESRSIDWGGGTVSASGTIQGIGRMQEGIDFIPPQSKKTRSFLTLATSSLKEINFEGAPKRPLEGRLDQPSVRHIDFDLASSPLKFRSYISFSTQEDGSGGFSLDHRFYVSGAYKSLLGPDAVVPIQGRGDRFYTSRSTGVGTGVALVAGAALIVVASGRGD